MILVGSLLTFWAALPARAGDTIELDQKFNDPLHMEKYGGLNKDLIVQETDQDGIRYSIVDFTRMIWRSQLTGQSYPDGASFPRDSSYVQVPTIIERKRKKGDPEAGSGIDGTYLLYEEPSTGLKISYKDTLATPADAVRLKIVPGYPGR